MGIDSADVTHPQATDKETERPEAAGRQQDNATPDTGRITWLTLAAIAVFVLVGFFLFRSTGQDDGYISYWPAHTLAHYGHIVNYSGEAVEQSSSLLWVLILGICALVTRAPVPLLGPLLSIAGGALAVVLASRLATRMNRRISPYAVLFTASAAYLMYWSFSGMETSFVGVCTVWLALAYSDYLSGMRARIFEVLAATLCCALVRPEMSAVLGVLVVGIAAALWIRRQRGLQEAEEFKGVAGRIGILLLVALGCILGIAAFRLAYFHSLVPEPALVKGVKQFHLMEGLTYLYQWMFQPNVSCFMLPVACLTLVGIGWTLKEALTDRAMNLARLVCALLLLVYGGFILSVGGDWMLAGRFLVHILPVAIVLAADTLGRFTPTRFLPATGAAITLIQLGGIIWYAIIIGVGTSPLSAPQGVDPQIASGFSWFERNNRLYLRDAAPEQAVDRVVTRMRATGSPTVHLFSGQMGFVMYTLGTKHYGQLDVTDRHGLADGRLVGCSVSKGQPQKANGLDIRFDWFLAHQKELTQECHIPAPDIIYDIGSSNAKDPAQLARQHAAQLQQYGYALVYHRFCNVPPNRDWLPGDNKIAVEEYIAVRKELLPTLGMHEVPIDQFQDATL